MAYIKQHHTTGVAWKAGGIPLSQYKAAAAGGGGAAGAPPAAPKPPPCPAPGMMPPPPPPPMMAPGSSDLGTPQPAAKPAGGSGMSAVFAQINQGEGITSGLKHVSAAMKTKNMKEEDKKPIPQQHAQAQGQAQQRKAVQGKMADAVQHEPKTSENQGKWYVVSNRSIILVGGWVVAAGLPGCQVVRGNRAHGGRGE